MKKGSLIREDGKQDAEKPKGFSGATPSNESGTRRCYAHVGSFRASDDGIDRKSGSGSGEKWKIHACHFSEHSVETVQKEYLQRGRPLLIHGLGPALFGEKVMHTLGKHTKSEADDPTRLPSTRDVLEYLTKVTGSKRVGIHCRDKHVQRPLAGDRDPLGNVSFAKLSDYCRLLIDTHIDGKDKEEGPTQFSSSSRSEEDEDLLRRAKSHYLYDVSLKKQLPRILDDFKLPRHIQGDLLQSTMRRHHFVESWPTLFVASPGTNSTLHIDQWHGSFWMVQVAGSKRWTLFHPDDYSKLSPIYHPSDARRVPGYKADKDGERLRAAFRDLREMERANLKSGGKAYPELRTARRAEVILEPGDILFVPGGTPHYVENLEVTVAYAGNFVDVGNYRQAVQSDLFHMGKRGGLYTLTHRALSEICVEDDHSPKRERDSVEKKKVQASEFIMDYFDDYSGLLGMMP